MTNTVWQGVPVPGWSLADAVWQPDWVDPASAQEWFERLKDTVSWNQESMVFSGVRVPVPRLTAWFGDPEATYSYSGLRHTPLPWTPLLLDLRDRVGQATGARYNSVLLNLYRDGRDSVAWHADDELELGRHPTIASLSLGAARRFRWKHRAEAGKTGHIELPPGSLLVMRNRCQEHWLHAVPKTTRPVGARINLTFRWFHPRRGP